MAKTIDELVTPALLLDLDVFEANLSRLTDTLRTTGCGFRPHVKTHKCPEIAKRQIAAGALGVSAATIGEAEAMVAAGIGGVLLTSPVVSAPTVGRLVSLAERAPDLMAVVDHRVGVERFTLAAAEAGVTLNVLVDLDVGDHRSGVAPGEPAVELAQCVAASASLRFRGFQAYSGGSSHVVGYEKRAAHSRAAMGRAVQTRRRLEAAGVPVDILSGGSTGTYDIDSGIDGVTELQVGSFVFMDLDYRRIGGPAGDRYTDFGQSLTVLSTVHSANHAGCVSIDAGIKSFSTETGIPPEPVGLTGARYTITGDEFGRLELDRPSCPVRLGDRVRLVVPHCDPTVNLYDRIHCLRGDHVVDTWPIVARRGP